MDTLDKSPLVVPFFYTATVENPAKSKEAGRPIFDEVEMVEVRIAGDRNFNPHFPAHEMHVRQGDEEITYAMRWPEEYARFKAQETQVANGTPLDELTFLSAARRSELKALKIYTAEALAALDGPQLKVLAGEGYKLKEQAQAYLERSSGFAGANSLAIENAELRSRLANLERMMSNFQQDVAPDQDMTNPPLPESDPYEGLSDDELKEKIADLIGTRPRGNPSRETLIRNLNDIQRDQAA